MSDAPAKQTFHSILAPSAAVTNDDVAEPGCFHDLNLDQVVGAIAAAWPEQKVASFFYQLLHDPDAIGYRQETFRDLERASLHSALDAFKTSVNNAHARLVAMHKLHNEHERACAFLHAADIYCAATGALAAALQDTPPSSPSLRALHVWLDDYMASTAFEVFTSQATTLASALDGIRYELIVRDDRVIVRDYQDEVDASVAIEASFAKFRRDATTDYRSSHHGRIGINNLNHVETQVLDKVALLNPQTFAALDAFCTEHEQFVHPTLARLAREACFYLAWIAYTKPLRGAGLPLCFPAVDSVSKTTKCRDAFDIALASAQIQSGRKVVLNDVQLRDTERIMVVSGPNNGGKTTYARMVGQLHWLAALGCTVPGSHARLFLFDRLFTHFESEEAVDTLRGKLKDDLFRIHRILDEATPRSLIILNEIFASTTLDDALWLGRRIMARISRLDALAVCVTFLTELADFDAKTVSVVAAVDPEDPAIRTHKLERRAADGLAYALAIARKYRVTHEGLLERIAP